MIITFIGSETNCICANHCYCYYLILELLIYLYLSLGKVISKQTEGAKSELVRNIQECPWKDRETSQREVFVFYYYILLLYIQVYFRIVYS